MDQSSVFDNPALQIKQEPRSPPARSQTTDSPPVALKSETPREDSEDDSETEDEDMDTKPRILTHRAAMEEFQDGLAELIIGDELLSDLPAAITLEEVNSLISLEHGRAIVVNVRRADDIVLPVVVVQNGTVQDLKKAIQRHVILKQRRENGTEHISWRYVWRTYWLYFDGQKLMEDNKLIKEFGIRNRDEVTFIKRLKKK